MNNSMSSDILWSAQEAKQMTKESIKNFNSQQLSDISQKITNAITDGDFSIDYEGELEDKTYKKCHMECIKLSVYKAIKEEEFNK